MLGLFIGLTILFYFTSGFLGGFIGLLLMKKINTKEIFQCIFFWPVIFVIAISALFKDVIVTINRSKDEIKE